MNNKQEHLNTSDRVIYNGSGAGSGAENGWVCKVRTILQFEHIDEPGI